jgi:hypothetical protein
MKDRTYQRTCGQRDILAGRLKIGMLCRITMSLRRLSRASAYCPRSMRYLIQSQEKQEVLRKSYGDIEAALFQICVWADGEAGSET